MKTQKWTKDNIPDIQDKTVLITGANSGLGFEASKALAEKGATVIMASRDRAKGEKAVQTLTEVYPSANIDLMQLDLSSLQDVRKFADEFNGQYETLDILINNAGVMAPPYNTTADGFELQIGVNHLGPFALTGLILKKILAAPTGRIVMVSSFIHKIGSIRFNDIHWKRKYARWPAYGQSKLANLLFTYELDRRLQEANLRTMAVAAHPGYARTSLQRHTGLFSFLNHFMAQSPQMGVLPILYAATEWQVGGGQFFGPNGIMELRGYPRKTRSSALSYDMEIARKLWALSEELTGVRYSFSK